MNKEKLIIIIGAGNLQKDYLSFAKKYNLKIALTDRNPNSIYKNDVDFFLESDGSAADQIIKFAKSLSEIFEIIGFYCGNDFGLITVAKLGEIFDLPYASVSSTEIALNKSKTKEILQKNNISTPLGITCDNLDEALRAFDKFNKPLVIKPVDSSGSRGVSVVEDMNAFINAYKFATNYSKEVLIEELITGRHIDTNALLINSKLIPLGTGERFFSEYPTALTLRGIAPAQIKQDVEKNVYKMLDDSAREIGIKNGPIKGDFILKDNKLYLLEITPRFHGDIYSVHTYKLLYEKSIIESFFEYIATKKIPNTNNEGKIKACFYPIFADPGHIREIYGVDQARTMPGITDIIILKEKNFIIKSNIDNNSIIGFIIGKGFDYQDIYNNVEKSRKKITFKFY